MNRAERRYRTNKVLHKRIPFVKRMYRTSWGYSEPIPAKRLGQCRDRHPFDCGHSKCFCCHSDKLDQVPKPQQIRADLDFCEEKMWYNLS